MNEYKSFGRILREQNARYEKQQKQMADAAIEICAANPPVLKLMPQMLDYEALIADRKLEGEEKMFVLGTRALDMVVHMDGLPNPSRCFASGMLFDIHILPRLDTPYPDRYGVVVISLLEEAKEMGGMMVPESFDNRIKAVKARLSYGLESFRNDS
jgi:hypothetical protein